MKYVQILMQVFFWSQNTGGHSKTVIEADHARMYKELRKLRPFRHTPGRTCEGFNIGHVLLKSEDFPKMKSRINQIITRLTRGFIVAVEDEEDDNDNEKLEHIPPL